MQSFKFTKILATIGPSSNNLATVKKMIDAGVNIFRINFSHITTDEHFAACKKLVDDIYELRKRDNINVSILGDLQGPKIRIGNVVPDTSLAMGDIITITTDHIPQGTKELVSTTYLNLPNDVKPGDHILVDDGLIGLEVIAVEGVQTKCKVKNGGELKSNKGLNLPNIDLSTPALTEKDKADLLFAMQQSFDFIALSFVRKVEDIHQIKQIIKDHNSQINVIAKIEKPEAVQNIDAIINASFGIMIARGDLGVEMETAAVPIYQKEITKKCNILGKPVIIATQMLDSMQRNPRPTRAEANDVSNAVLDGADCLMLSGETASGKYPVITVDTMSQIIISTEQHFYERTWENSGESLKHKEPIEDPTKLICRSAIRIAKDIKASLILCITHSGTTARQLSKYRPSIPVIAVTCEESVMNKLAMSWGVKAFLVDKINYDIKFFEHIHEILNAKLNVQPKSKIIITCGLPKFAENSTNVIKIHEHKSVFEPFLP